MGPLQEQAISIFWYFSGDAGNCMEKYCIPDYQTSPFIYQIIKLIKDILGYCTKMQKNYSFSDNVKSRIKKKKKNNNEICVFKVILALDSSIDISFLQKYYFYNFYYAKLFKNRKKMIYHWMHFVYIASGLERKQYAGVLLI